MSPEPVTARRRSILAALACVGLLALAVAAPSIGRAAPPAAQDVGGEVGEDELAPVADRAVQRLREYLRVDTVNPPGNEIRGAEYFAAILEEEGIEYEIAESEPGRGNIWARLEGGDEPGLLLLHHMDVVPADRQHWRVDPMQAVVEDGYVYGRGALDTKSLGILHLQAFLELARSEGRLRRDVVFMATADEEAGGFYGAGWLVENRPELFEGIGTVLNEGGGTELEEAGVTVSVEVTQKVPLWLRLVAEDEPGHGSMPRAHSAVTRLVDALDRIAEHDFRARIVPVVGEYFRALSLTAPEPWSEAFAAPERAVEDRDFLTRLQLHSPFLHALTRNTCSLTVLEGSDKINVVPPEATAEIDCRLLPDQDPDAFVAELETVINDPGIRIERIMGFTPAVSDPDSDTIRTIQEVTRRFYPQARVIPSVLSGFTDSHFFRDLGIDAYGYDPMIVPAADIGGVHGNDERIAVEQVRTGTRIMIELLRELALE